MCDDAVSEFLIVFFRSFSRAALIWRVQEYPFFTVKTLPPGFVLHLGGVVSARSVKLLDKIHNPGICRCLASPIILLMCSPSANDIIRCTCLGF